MRLSTLFTSNFAHNFLIFVLIRVHSTKVPIHFTFMVKKINFQLQIKRVAILAHSH